MRGVNARTLRPISAYARRRRLRPPALGVSPSGVARLARARSPSRTARLHLCMNWKPWSLGTVDEERRVEVGEATPIATVRNGSGATGLLYLDAVMVAE